MRKINEKRDTHDTTAITFRVGYHLCYMKPMQTEFTGKMNSPAAENSICTA
jgi:hypothetical protein